MSGMSSGYEKEYSQKLISADKAVDLVSDGMLIDYGWSNTATQAFDKALAARIGDFKDLMIRSAMLLRVPEIFKVENPAEHFTYVSWHMSGICRKTIDAGFGFFSPIRYSEINRYYLEGPNKADIAVFQVAPMDSKGYFNFGPVNSHIRDMAKVAGKVILEVNEKMPYCFGKYDENLHISEVDFIIEGKDNDPLPELSASPISDVDRKVAEQIVAQIPNGACVQIGVGGMSSAVAVLMAESDLKDLGVHTELYVDGFVEMSKSGKINGRKKQVDIGKQVYAFAAGTKELYEYLDGNPSCQSSPVNYTNDVRVISAIDNFVSINAAVDIDLFGQINAESAGRRHISGAGGQLDFVLGAYLSNGGKSFICLSSSFKDKQGNINSRIRPTLSEGSIVTDTRQNTQYLVTEYGMVNLKGLTTWQRAEAIISIAHPDFREELVREAEALKIWKRSNK
jgi:butyryl-CoA:acetate CoA-transferase